MNYLYDLNISELDDLIDLISEDISNELGQYDDLDFLDAFVFLFKKWLSENHQEKSTKFPFSYLVKKYGDKFAYDLFGDSYSSSKKLLPTYWGIRQFMIDVVRSGLYTLPSAKKEQKFSERFKKPLDKFIKSLRLDDSVTLEILEPSQYDLVIFMVIDFPNYLKSDRYIPDPHTFEHKLKEFAEGYLGVDIGEPVTGGLRVSVRERLLNEEEWTKDVLNKEIKKEIRKIPFSKNIQRILFKIGTVSPSKLEIVFKSGTPRGGNIRSEFKQEVIRYIDSLGYKKIRVELSGY